MSVLGVRWAVKRVTSLQEISIEILMDTRVQDTEFRSHVSSTGPINFTKLILKPECKGFNCIEDKYCKYPNKNRDHTREKLL